MATPIPQPPGIPLVGNIFDVDPSNTWVSLQKLWEKYGQLILTSSAMFLNSYHCARRDLQDNSFGPTDRLRGQCRSLRRTL